MSDYGYMTEGYDDVDESHGFSDEPLPSGWYPLRVEKVLSSALSKNGSPSVRLQVQVTEGALQDKRAFVGLNLGPALVDAKGTQRSEKELKDIAKTIQGQMKGFLSSLGVTTGPPVGEKDEAVYSFFNVGSWTGKEFMGFIKLMPAKGDWSASNRLNGYRSIGDEKQGLDAWRAKQSGAASETKAETI
jgi:hypothetical protein